MTRKQEILLQMMKWLHGYLEKENIRYFALGGTALGAVRHQGFIPWDDDMDIGVPRADYERLKEISKTMPQDSPYRLEFPLENEDYDYTFAKLYDVNTTLVENTKREAKRGVYIDIFPLDGAGNRLEGSRKILKKINIQRKIFIAKYNCLSKKRKFYKTFVIFCVRAAPAFISGKRAIMQRIEKLCKKNEYEESVFVGNLFGAWGEREIMPRETLGVPKLAQFEDMQIYIPENHDEYLTYLYGDYMTPPPPEKQKSHHDYIYENLNESYLAE